MSRADRLERLDNQRLALEVQFKDLLIAALERAAGGSWGLFQHNTDKFSRKAWEPAVAELVELGEQIDAARMVLAWNRSLCLANFSHRAVQSHQTRRANPSRPRPGLNG